MGVVYTFFAPLILFLVGVAFISPLIGLVCAIAAILCVVVLVIAARRMLRAQRGWVRGIGAVLIPFAGLAALAFTVVAVISFIVAVYFYGEMATAN